MWTTANLITESDVEQKFIFPLLVEALPLGLGIPAGCILTKSNVRRFAIGKGTEKKIYYPDYLITNDGFPLVVIEAKKPSEPLAEGYREARLYAEELNALYQHELAPTNFVVACNGLELWFGYADQAEPLCKAACDSFGTYSPSLAQLIDLISWPKITALSKQLAKTIKPEVYFKPRRLLGGLSVQNEEVGQNAFGATLTASISNIFNPDTKEDRAFIARHGYISSHRRDRYVEPIDRVIKAARSPSESDSKEIEDTQHPKELVKKFEKTRELEHKVLLLIGSVGSGKSTFVDHLCEVALPREVLNTTVWCRINMNVAPVSNHEIYPWLRKRIVEECKESCPGIDFEDFDGIKRVYSHEINHFNKTIGKILKSQENELKTRLADYVIKLMADEQITTTAHVRFATADRGKLLIIVLDNSDKKNLDEQLLMFQAAQWLQQEYRCLVILPMRDETYDNHRDQPPLDTALKDLVFRIEPPMFQQVLIRRVELALDHLSINKKDKLKFSLPNGITVEYPRSEQAFYLTSMIKSLFEHDRFVRRMIIGLSGRNIRRALELFLEFCNSGHIREDQIFQIRTSEGAHTLPLHQVATVLLRLNKRFYDSDQSYIKNLFAINQDDPIPVYFCRLMVLNWLHEHFSMVGPCGNKGYFPVYSIKTDLMPYGLNLEILDRALKYLLASHCIVAEHLRVDILEDQDLIKLGPAGFVHLELVGNFNYLAAVAEDTFFTDRVQAERIADRIRIPERQLSIKTSASNAEELVNFLEIQRGYLHPPGGDFINESLVDRLSNIEPAKAAIKRIAENFSNDPWFGADKTITRYSSLVGIVVCELAAGWIIEFVNGLSGYLPKDKTKGIHPGIGDEVKVKVLWIDCTKQRMGLELEQILLEEVGDGLGM
jgi:hypothetical protein